MKVTANTKEHYVAIIHEKQCIGCTKCIDACPVDAILGSKNRMHTVIMDACIGCQLCIPPCPVDCIDMVVTTTLKPASGLVKQRHKARKERLENHEERLDVSVASDKKRYVLDALARVKSRKK